MNFLKYLLGGIALFLLALLASFVTWGSPFVILSSGAGWLARGLYILPAIMIFLGFVRNLKVRKLLAWIVTILFILILLNSFVFGFIRL